MLAYYGQKVTVCEAHYHAGGAAHAFDVQGYTFDSGASLAVLHRFPARRLAQHGACERLECSEGAKYVTVPHESESWKNLARAGPSFFAGMSNSPSSNPLKQVLDVIGEDVPCKTYDRWIVHAEDGTYPCIADGESYRQLILERGGPEALQQWKELEKAMEPLQRGAGLLPAVGMRDDLGVLLTAGYFGIRAGWTFAETGLQASTLTGPFSKLVDKV
jgi:hypothetical protein